MPGHANDNTLRRIKPEATAMRQNPRHKRSEVRTYTSLSRRVRQRLRLWTRAGLSRPCTHDDGRACPSTLPNPARIGYAPGPSRPGPGLRRALPLRDLPRRGLRHDDGRAWPSTLPNPARIGYAPGPCRPGPALKGALLPEPPSLRASAPRHPRSSVPPLDQSARRWRPYPG